MLESFIQSYSLDEAESLLKGYLLAVNVVLQRFFCAVFPQ